MRSYRSVIQDSTIAYLVYFDSNVDIQVEALFDTTPSVSFYDGHGLCAGPDWAGRCVDTNFSQSTRGGGPSYSNSSGFRAPVILSEEEGTPEACSTRCHEATHQIQSSDQADKSVHPGYSSLQGQAFEPHTCGWKRLGCGQPIEHERVVV
jgi:hypothetical protein